VELLQRSSTTTTTIITISKEVTYCLYSAILLSGGVTKKECNCGEANEAPTLWNRIAGGEKAGLHEFPWVVSLHELTTKVNGVPFFFCTGALIDPTHVLTAAHCVRRRDAYEIMVILANTNKMSPHPQHVAVNVTRIYKHPSYNGFLNYCTSLIIVCEADL